MMPPSSGEDLSHLRRNYEKSGLERDDLKEDPVAQFRHWFEEARADSSVLEPNAMSLSTVGADGQPSIRTVLLKAYDERGFVFFTNYGSNKAQQIAENPQVALLFFWPSLERQIKIQGKAFKVSRAESVSYFLSRPRGSRLGAWVSEQSSVVSNRSLLLSKLEEMKRRFAEGDIPCPDFWGGFRVEPTLFEFWQGGGDRLHDRFEYRPGESNPENWEIRRLAP